MKKNGKKDFSHRHTVLASLVLAVGIQAGMMGINFLQSTPVKTSELTGQVNPPATNNCVTVETDARDLNEVLINDFSTLPPIAFYFYLFQPNGQPSQVPLVFSNRRLVDPLLTLSPIPPGRYKVRVRAPRFWESAAYGDFPSQGNDDVVEVFPTGCGVAYLALNQRVRRSVSMDQAEESMMVDAPDDSASTTLSDGPTTDGEIPNPPDVVAVDVPDDFASTAMPDDESKADEGALGMMADGRNYYPTSFCVDPKPQSTTFKFADGTEGGTVESVCVKNIGCCGGSGARDCYCPNFVWTGLPACGNSTVEPGEQCDDGNTYDFDGCTAGCVLDSPIQPSPTIDEGPSPMDVTNEPLSLVEKKTSWLPKDPLGRILSWFLKSGPKPVLRPAPQPGLCTPIGQRCGAEPCCNNGVCNGGLCALPLNPPPSPVLPMPTFCSGGAECYLMGGTRPNGTQCPTAAPAICPGTNSSPQQTGESCIEGGCEGRCFNRCEAGPRPPAPPSPPVQPGPGGNPVPVQPSICPQVLEHCTSQLNGCINLIGSACKINLSTPGNPIENWCAQPIGPNGPDFSHATLSQTLQCQSILQKCDSQYRLCYKMAYDSCTQPEIASAFQNWCANRR